jgi:hypothetical protein
MTRRIDDELQLDLFSPPVISLPPCGRCGCPREAIIEHSSSGSHLRCTVCNCSAPYKPRGQNTPPTEAPRSTDALSTVLNGFMQAQMNFFEFLQQQESPPARPAKQGTEGGPTCHE